MELTLSGGVWSEAVIYDFTAGWSIGYFPMSGVIVDTAGNLYGTIFSGGLDPPECDSGGGGAVFELSPSESGWNPSCLHSFTGGSDGASPVAGLVSDSSGNLYGATSAGYPTPHATIFMLSPSPSGWVYHLLYTFDNDDESPWATLAMDAAGNLYSETYADKWGVNMGHVFKLTRGSSGWTYSNLHAFCSWQNCTDGVSALSGVLVDKRGNLYGTTTQGGAYGAYGVVWEITP